MIKVSNLTKYYGDFKALDDISFEIEEGEIYGFLGPNGAGKSTTMNIITGCLSPSSGSVNICGYDILEEPILAKSQIGYLPEIPPLYLNETPEEFLTFVARAKGIKGEKIKEEVNKVIEETKISDVSKKLISSLSKGYRQRVGIAEALLGNPKVIILDEPTVGLDPIQIIEIRDLIKSLGANHTVILSSHILSEVSAICNKVLIIAKGKLIAFDTPANLENLMNQGHHIIFTVMATKDNVSDLLKDSEDIKAFEISENENGSLTVDVTPASDEPSKISSNLNMLFAHNDIPVTEISTKKASLEDIFIELTENEGEKE